MSLDIGVPAGGHPALELLAISKRFGDVQAIDDVSFAARVGTVHALVGENGAGKTSLMRVAYGLLRPDRGSVRLFGRPVTAHSVRGAMDAGIGMVQQQLSLVPTLTAAENVALGGRGVFRPADARDELASLSHRVGLRVDPGARARDLSVVEQQRLEILKALARGARILILDEPTSGLAPAEIDDLLRWIGQFTNGGGTVVLVTHRLREALAVADDVTVLRRGRVADVSIGLRAPEPRARRTVADLARAMFPDAPDASQWPVASLPEVAPGEPVVMLENVSIRDGRGVQRIASASLAIGRGEIVGIAAVEGSGHRALLRVLAGVDDATEGRVVLPPRIALVPADRLREALIPRFTLVENVALRGAGDRRGVMSWRDQQATTIDLIGRYGIVAPSANVPAGTLSGGNQQRLVVARELSRQVDLVVADDPTRGLDVRASGFVHQQLRDAASRGAAVVVHSSDIDELLALATRMLVVFHGAARAVPLDRAVIGRAMVGSE